MERIKDEKVRGDEAAARRRDGGRSVQAHESTSMRRGEWGEGKGKDGGYKKSRWRIYSTNQRKRSERRPPESTTVKDNEGRETVRIQQGYDNKRTAQR
jgi:hypothetical protein